MSYRNMSNKQENKDENNNGGDKRKERDSDHAFNKI